MADKTYPGLPEAVEQSLRRGGPALLSNPQRLLAFLADAMHPESMELRVLLRCCDDEMLAPFARADQMSTSELQMAGSRMQAYLTDECMVDARSAATVAMDWSTAPPNAARGVKAQVMHISEREIADRTDLQHPGPPVPQPGKRRQSLRRVR